MTILLFNLIYNKNMIRVSQEGGKYLIIERLKALFKVKKKKRKKTTILVWFSFATSKAVCDI